MAISETAIRKAKGKDKPYRLTDGDGLYAIIRPNDAKWWRLDYRLHGSRKTMSLGTYPEVSLADARSKRDGARRLVAAGVDPIADERKRKGTVNEPDTFGTLADEYLKRLRDQGMSAATVAKNEWCLKTLAADLGDKAISEITAADVLKVIKHIEASGRIETAHRVRAGISSVFRLAISTLRAETDPTYALRGAIVPKRSKSHSAITDERPFGSLLRVIDDFDGWVTLRAALQIMCLCYPRPIELRMAEWRHIDFEAKVWTVPEHVAKMRRPHDIPLSRQTIAILKGIRSFSGRGTLVFPSVRSLERPLSENAMNSALRRMGYTKEEHCSHGFRASASSILNRRKFPSDVIEHSLAHVEQNAVRRAYNRYEYWDERVEMAQTWADICDDLKRRSRRNDDLV